VQLDSLLRSLASVSGGRILPHCEQTTEDDVTKVLIPVARQNSGDMKDVAMRRFAKDWVKRNAPGRVGVEARFVELGVGVSFYHAGEEYPVVAQIEITWWAKPEKSEDEEDDEDETPRPMHSPKRKR